MADPTHHIAKQALGVVLELALDQVGAEHATSGKRRNGQHVGNTSPRPGDQVELTLADIENEIVGGVQGGRCGRRHPGTVRAGQGMADLSFEHLGHGFGSRPHTLADLGPTLQATGQTSVDVGVFVALEPRGALHLALRQHGAGFHVGVDLVAGAVEEAGVDEEPPARGPHG